MSNFIAGIYINRYGNSWCEGINLSDIFFYWDASWNLVLLQLKDTHAAFLTSSLFPNLNVCTIAHQCHDYQLSIRSKTEIWNTCKYPVWTCGSAFTSVVWSIIKSVHPTAWGPLAGGIPRLLLQAFPMVKKLRVNLSVRYKETYFIISIS